MGHVDTIVHFNSMEYPICFHIVEKLPSHIAGLISTDYLKKHNAKIDFAKIKMEFDIPEGNCFTIPANGWQLKFWNFFEASMLNNKRAQREIRVCMR